MRRPWRSSCARTSPARSAAVDALFNRYQHNLEMIWGHTQEIRRELNTPADLDTGPVAPFDEAFAAWDPSAHVLDDLFDNRLAFIALLNFPLTSLEERERDGREVDAPAVGRNLLAENFPAATAGRSQPGGRPTPYADIRQYIAGYNIWMHHLVDARASACSRAGKRLLSHWNLRDELKANYADSEAGLARQRTIQRVMERIVAQEIPAVVIDNPAVDWNPYTNAVARSPVNDAPAGEPPHALPDGPVDAAREPDARYAALAGELPCQQVVDTYSPSQPTHIMRVFEPAGSCPRSGCRPCWNSCWARRR